MCKKQPVPEYVLAAASTLLAPFDIDIRKLLANSACGSDDTKDDRTYIGIDQTTRCYGIGRCTISRLIKAGKIRAMKLSPARAGKVLVDRKSLSEYLSDKTYGELEK